jgi:hypothetical protein
MIIEAGRHSTLPSRANCPPTGHTSLAKLFSLYCTTRVVLHHLDYVYRPQQARGERSSRFFRPLTRCASSIALPSNQVPIYLLNPTQEKSSKDMRCSMCMHSTINWLTNNHSIIFHHAYIKRTWCGCPVSHLIIRISAQPKVLNTRRP